MTGWGEAGASARSPVLVIPESGSSVGESGWRALFEHAPIGKAVVAPDGRWLLVNPALCELTGYRAEQLLAGRFHDITHPDDLNVDQALLADCLAGQRDRYEIDKRYLRADGTLIWVTLSVSLVRDTDRRPLYFIAQMRDVTESIAAKQRLEEALAVSEAAVRALQDVDELKTRLLSVTNHELRTPLTSILGFAKTLDLRWDEIDDTRRRSGVTAIHQQARRLRDLIDDLLLLSAHQAGTLLWEPAAVPPDELADNLRARHPDVDVRVRGTGALQIDPDQIHGMVDRLISNARRHGAAPIVVTINAEPGRPLIAVEDSGPGVPAEFEPMLFGLFEQADNSLTRAAEGAGLGLAAVAALAGVAGATVSYEARTPTGARFTLGLPAAAAAA